MDVTPPTNVRTPPIDRSRELLKSAVTVCYKTVGDSSLNAYIWQPDASQAPSFPKPAAAFFFSSGWDHGQVSQFAPHAVYFASRGMMTVAFEYRVGSTSPGAGPLEAISDAGDAIRWLRINAVDLDINPGKVVGVGGSGGAHALVANALIPSEKGSEGSGVPNAFVLFNPVLDTTRSGFGLERFPDDATAKKFNLVKAVKAGLPPALIFHGTGDRVVPFAGSYEFAKKASRKKNQCRLVSYEGAGHGFFNFNLSFENYESTLMAMDEFLVELGFLPPDPNIGLGEVEMIR